MDRDIVMSKVEYEGDCWVWVGPYKDGRPVYGHNKVNVRRWLYEREYASVKRGKKIVMVCEHVKCVNPAHAYVPPDYDEVAARKRYYAARQDELRAKSRERQRQLRSENGLSLPRGFIRKREQWRRMVIEAARRQSEIIVI